MIIYSQTINIFLARLRKYARQILQNEMKINVRRNRFQWNGYLIPFHLVVFERKNVLGQFDHHTYQIGINRHLIYSAKSSVLKDILRHELAHFICYLTYGTTIANHGKEFKEICHRYGWEYEVSKACANIENLNNKIEGDIPSERIISKVKKLLNLASSDNGYEAELATIKANQLLLKYNLGKLDQDEEELVYVKRVLSGKRNNSKFKTIYEILKTFLVSPVFNYGKGIVYLEVIGDYVNVELAEYVAHFLEIELEKLWKKTAKENPKLKGATAKNSFMRGVASGYIEKIRLAQKSHSSGKELVHLDKMLQQKVHLVYARVSSSTTTITKSCRQSENLGNSVGKKLSIRPGIKSNSLTNLLTMTKS